MAEILNATSYSNHRCFASEDMTESTLFTWSNQEEYITHATASSAVVGIVLEDILQGEACGDRVCFFTSRGKIRATVNDDLTCGDIVQSDATGQIVALAAGYPVGQMLEDADTGSTAKIYTF